jgi:hypothetical protein
VLANAPTDPSSPGGQRRVIKPLTPITLICLFAFITIGVVTAGACLVTGGLLPAVMCATVAAFGIYTVVSAELWVDGERVGGTGVFMWGSCRRDELDHMMIGGRNQCLFFRKDGRVAFSAPGLVFGNAKLQALADLLGVPLYGTVTSL